MDRTKYYRERMRQQRADNTEYIQRQRAAKRSERVKAKRREQRQTPEQKEKEKLYAREYRKRPHVKAKNRARHKAKQALIRGIIKRPDNCETCGMPDAPLRDGRSGLRMDHHMGYDEDNWINVIFICVKCDGNQMIKREEERRQIP
jgi:hypothetical protein